LILAKHPQTQRLGDRNRATARLAVATEDVQQGRLPGAVGTDETVPLPRIALERSVREQRPVAEGLLEVRNRDHADNLTDWFARRPSLLDGDKDVPLVIDPGGKGLKWARGG